MEADKGEEEDEEAGSPTGVRNRVKQVERLKKKAERIRQFLKENGAKIGRRERRLRDSPENAQKFFYYLLRVMFP